MAAREIPADQLGLSRFAIPAVAPGVVIHLHDHFPGFEYPKEWVEEGRSWNEQYLLRALLMYSTGFRVVFGSAYAYWRFPEEVRAALAHPRGAVSGGGSLWMVRT